MRFTLKILLFIFINIVILNLLVIRDLNTYRNTGVFIRHIYSKPNYKYWALSSSTDYCNENSVLLKKEESETYFKKLKDNKINIVYLYRLDLTSCKDKIVDIAKKFHESNFEIAVNAPIIDLPENYQEFDSKKYSLQINSSFNGLVSINDWVDYLVIDNAMEALTFTERREVFTNIRKIFNKPKIGYRFPDQAVLELDKPHHYRKNKLIKEFFPMDNDGDFILTSIQVEPFRRTEVYIEDKSIGNDNVDGEAVLID